MKGLENSAYALTGKELDAHKSLAFPLLVIVLHARAPSCHRNHCGSPIIRRLPLHHHLDRWLKGMISNSATGT